LLSNTAGQTFFGCPNGSVWQPEPGTSWFWDLSGSISPATVDANYAQAYDFDLFTVSQETISYIHSLNRTAICYIDTAYEPFRPDASQFPNKVLGHDMQGWPGQKWVDIRSSAVRNIMLARLKLAALKGCDAIEWDDVDCYKNNPGFRISATDQLNFNIFLAQNTHDYHMSVGLKNDLDQIDELVDFFDWALDEQCYQYGECDMLKPFIDQGKAVFGAEYQGSAKNICPYMNGLQYSWISTNTDLTGKVTKCCSIASPPCQVISHKCVTPPDSYPDFSHAANRYNSLSISLLLFLVCIIFL